MGASYGLRRVRTYTFAIRAALVAGVLVCGSLDAQTVRSTSGDSVELGAWRHLTMRDIEVDMDMFQPIRTRYLQVMYDLEGKEEIQSRSVVTIDLDRAVHSGPWNGQFPIALQPFREPGLLITWQIQNALYNGFDRVLTDGHLSLSHRVMPGGGGLIVGSMNGSEHTRIHAVPPAPDSTVRVDRKLLNDGSINVLTIPYVLAAMDLKPGDRFTLPGYAMINGPDGAGVVWQGAFQVQSVTERMVKGRGIRITEVLFNRMDARNGLTVDQIDHTRPGQRATRLLVSSEPPYLVGRASLTRGEDGHERFIREFLGLIDWTGQPLPLSDLTAADVWDLDLEAGDMSLRADRAPPVLVPLRSPMTTRGVR